MGQKVSPNSLRFGLNKNWLSRWNSKNNKQFAQWLIEDFRIREYFKKTYKKALIDSVEIERTKNLKGKIFFQFFVHAANPALLQKEATVEKISKYLKKILGKETIIKFNIILLENPGVSAYLLAQEIVDGLEQRISSKFIQKNIVRKAMASDAKGIKIKVSGRINGNEIAWSNGINKGVVPLSTLSNDIDYSCLQANTTYGVLGVKVWVNRGFNQTKAFIGKPPAPKNKSKLAFYKTANQKYN